MSFNLFEFKIIGNIVWIQSSHTNSYTDLYMPTFQNKGNTQRNQNLCKCNVYLFYDEIVNWHVKFEKKIFSFLTRLYQV